MSARVVNFLQSDRGAMVTSILLGLGLATMFRLSCVGDSCVVMRAPDFADLKTSIYEMDGKCFQYTPTATACPEARARGT